LYFILLSLMFFRYPCKAKLKFFMNAVMFYILYTRNCPNRSFTFFQIPIKFFSRDSVASSFALISQVSASAMLLLLIVRIDNCMSFGWPLNDVTPCQILLKLVWWF
jgi:hypothetical protein